MKRWGAVLVFLVACTPEPSPLPPVSTPVATAAAIPEGRTPEQRRELFQSAVSLFEQGEFSSAEELFEKVAPVYPELADYTLRYLAKIAEKRGEGAHAIAEWGTLRDRYPDSVWKGEAELALGRTAATEQNWASAAELLAAAREDLKAPADCAAALGLGSEVALRLGNERQAHALALELRERYPRSPEAAAARERAWQQRDVALASIASARDEVSLLLSEGEGARALELSQLAERRFPADRDTPELYWLESAALSRIGEPRAAEQVLERIRARYPRHPLAARALFSLGSLAWNRDEDDRALRMFGSYARQYPAGPQAAEAVYATARIHQEARRFAPAAREFARLARLYPRSFLAAEARFRVGWCEYRAGNHRRAAAVFADVASGGGPEGASSLYWKGRASGDETAYRDLLREYPGSYYAGLAEGRLGEPSGSALSGHVTPAADSSILAATCKIADPHLTRFDELKAMRLSPLARGELAAYQERISGCDAFLIRSWAEVDGYRQSIARALRAGGCGIDGSWLSFCYPLGFWEVVEREATARDLDPLLVTALIRQESLFDGEARSRADALGLMQILPTTGRRLAAESGSADFDAKQLYDPARNVALGTAYLRDLADRFGGNLPRMLAAYNAGEAAVDKWQRRYPDLEDDEFVESISYRETRTYVKRVLQNRRWYQALYRATGPPPPATSG